MGYKLIASDLDCTLLRYDQTLSPENDAAIGDSPNDSTMILAAGLGLATANAAPALKEMADAVICSNEEHVAQYVLEHYLS